MLYPFMTLEDETEIVHSEPLMVDGREKVKVVIEQPVIGEFHSAVCWLLDYTWEKIEGFSREEINPERTVREDRHCPERYKQVGTRQFISFYPHVTAAGCRHAHEHPAEVHSEREWMTFM